MTKFLSQLAIALLLIIIVAGCSKRSAGPIEETYDHSYVGDVNINSVAYEIADAVTLTNYFLYGESVFTKNVDSQITASDVNMDEIPLTLSDLVYLIRAISDDAIRGQRLISNQQMYIYAGDTVSISDSCLGLYLEFEKGADIEFHPDVQDLMAIKDWSPINTIVLTFTNIRPGPILYTNGKLLTANASDFYGANIKTTIIYSE